MNDQEVVLDQGITDRAAIDGRGLVVRERGVRGEVPVRFGYEASNFHARQERGPLLGRDRRALVLPGTDGCDRLGARVAAESLFPLDDRSSLVPIRQPRAAVERRVPIRGEDSCPRTTCCGADRLATRASPTRFSWEHLHVGNVLVTPRCGERQSRAAGRRARIRLPLSFRFCGGLMVLGIAGRRRGLSFCVGSLEFK